MKKTVGVISLGCDKNRVDTEKMLYILSQKYDITCDIEKAKIIVINTCAFLESSREEAIDEIMGAILYKQNGSAEKIIVTGCLPQKYVGDLFNELIEVDAFLGVSDYQNILTIIDRIYNGERVNGVGKPKNEDIYNRVLSTKHYAYLKIADGCSNHCTYCTIPSIRGGYRSIKKETLIEEAKSLGDVKEVILVAQDTTKYGLDLQPKSSLVELIRALSILPNIGGIRLLYCYPENITDELIHEFSVNAKMIRYIDMPLQHADDKILKLMNRWGSKSAYLDLIDKLRKNIMGIAIRSTFITGFPQESDSAFNNLLDFIEKAKLFNAGFFKYSREEGTPSYKLDGQVLEKTKNKRLKKLYSVQKKVVKENGKKLKGSTYKVLAEGFDENQLVYFGRAYFNAPDVDGKIYFFSDSEVKYGEYVNVKITDASDYDIYGVRV